MTTTETTLSPAERIDSVARELGLTMTAVFVPWSQSRNKDEKHPSLNWLVTIRKRNTGHGPSATPRDILTTDYMAGSGHCPSYKSTWNRSKSYEKNKAIAWECEHGMPATVTNYGDVRRAAGGKPLLPELCDVLYSLASDADVLDAGGFEDWASNYDYDTDSRKAESIYRACLDIALKLRNALGENGLAQLREACQDY